MGLLEVDQRLTARRTPRFAVGSDFVRRHLSRLTAVRGHKDLVTVKPVLPGGDAQERSSVTCIMGGMRCEKLYIRRFRLKASEDTFDAHSGPAAVGRFSRMACSGERSRRAYSLARRPWCRHREMAPVKKRRLWPRKMDFWGAGARPTFSRSLARSRGALEKGGFT